MKNITIALVLVVLNLVACEEQEAITDPIEREETTTCQAIDFELSAEQSMDNEVLIRINAPLDSLKTGSRYSWDVTEVVDGETKVNENVVGGDNAFSWRVLPGTYEFCLNTTSEACPEGALTCKTLIVTEEQFDDARSPNVSSIAIVPTEDGNFTLGVELAPTSCQGVDFTFNSNGGQGIGIRAAEFPENVTFRWDITSTIDGEVTVSENVAFGDSAFGLNINDIGVGSHEFCLTTTSEACPEGAVICKILLVSVAQFDDANTDVSNINAIDIVPTQDGNFTIRVVRN